MDYTREDVKELLTTDDQAVCRGLLVIYGYQEDDEKVARVTNHLNGVGFNAVDAGIGSSLAEQLIQKKRLSVKQVKLARRILYKYTSQLEYAFSRDAGKDLPEFEIYDPEVQKKERETEREERERGIVDELKDAFPYISVVCPCGNVVAVLKADTKARCVECGKLILVDL